MPANSDYVFTDVKVAVNGVTAAAGSSIELQGTTTISGTTSMADLPINSGSDIVLTSSHTTTQMTSLIENLSGATAKAIATGMSAAQLAVLAVNDEKLNGNDAISGTMSITKDVSDTDIAILAAKINGAAAGSTMEVDMTGMTAAQENAVGAANGDIALDGIEGTFTLDKDNTGQIANILGDTDRSAIVTADATDMTDADVTGLANGINTLDTLTNVTYKQGVDANGDDVELTALLAKTTGMKAVGTGFDTAEKSALNDGIAKVAAGGITALTLDQNDTATIMSSLLTKSTGATFDGTGVDASTAAGLAQLGAAVGGIANITTVQDVTFTKDIATATHISTLLAKSTAAADATVVTLTGMSDTQVAEVAANINNPDTINGEATATQLGTLDTAKTTGLLTTAVSKVTGTHAEILSNVVAANLRAGDDAASNSVTASLVIAADAAMVVTDADGVALTAAQLDVLKLETTGANSTVTVSNAVTISGTEAQLAATLVEASGANSEYEANEDGVIAAKANLVMSDADAVGKTAVEMSDLGQTTSGTVTVTNKLEITGSEAEMTAALVTADTKVIAAASNFTVTGFAVTAFDADDEVLYNAIDAANNDTTATVTINAADGGNRDMSFENHVGAGLILVGGNGNDTIAGSQYNDTITSGDGTDDVDGGAGNDLITVSAGNDVDKITGGAGNDTFILDDQGEADEYYEAANGGTDTFVLNANSMDLSAIKFGVTKAAANAAAAATTLTEIEQIVMHADSTLTLVGSQITGEAIAINAAPTNATATINITAAAAGGALDASLLTFTSFNYTTATGTTATGVDIDTNDVINLTGAAGADTITGTSLGDTLDGKGGIDVLAGGAGNDTYLFTVAMSAGDDVVEAAGKGTDTISTAGAGGDIDLTGLESGGTANAALSNIEQLVVDTGRTVTFNAGSVDGVTLNVNELAAGTATLKIDLSDGNDTLDASNFTFAAAGGDAWESGTDVVDINGGTGDDTITGSSAVDTITGGNGADTIKAGAGDDVINGGAGIDKIQFTDTNGTDAITFVRDSDLLDFSKVTANGTIAEQAIANDAGTTLGATTLGANTTVYYIDTDATELGSATATSVAAWTAAGLATWFALDDGIVAGNNNGNVNYFVINDASVTTKAYVVKHTDGGDNTVLDADELEIIGVTTHDAGALDVNDGIIA
jgi:hypothetical protein